MGRRPRAEGEEVPTPRKRDENYTIISLLVRKEWSNKVSEYARLLGYTKQSLIVQIVDEYLKAAKKEEKEINFEEALDKINRKLDTLVTILPELIKKV